MRAESELGRVDLHTHSSASDGIYAPAEVIRRAAQEGLAAVALTDHDTVAGIEEALAAGKIYGIEVVPGVEISAYHLGKEIHLLAYYPAIPEKLRQSLDSVRQERYQRMDRMLNKLKSMKINLSMEDILNEAKTAAPGRLHLARVLLKKKYVTTLKEAFTLFLARGKPAYAPRKAMTSLEAMKIFQEAGALPVLAHPGSNGQNLVPELVSIGLRGVEVFHPDHNPTMTQYYLDLANEMGMLITGGSDFHGDSQIQSRRPGGVTAPYRCLELLKLACY